jgi:hypothetical protein
VFLVEIELDWVDFGFFSEIGKNWVGFDVFLGEIELISMFFV